MLENFSYSLILASKSPRRQFLLQEAGFKFEVKAIDTDESYPADLHPEKVAAYITEKKAAAYKPHLKKDEVVITADTVVILNNQVLGKPADKPDAQQMLRALSGNKHLVVTGICISSLERSMAFADTTTVYFKPLTEKEIDYYVDNYRPYDKAGAYGAQEWLGMIAVEKIEGSYFNVMGLPVHRLYEALAKF